LRQASFSDVDEATIESSRILQRIKRIWLRTKIILIL